MKTILWAALTANGNYAQSSPKNPPKAETLADFAAQARAAGNFIVGRRTFEFFQAGAGPGQGGNPFAALDIVVISNSVDKPMPGVTVVSTPREALAHLAGKGHSTALLAGGTTLHNTFLAEGLVDELIFDIVPVLEGKGFNLLPDQTAYRADPLELVGTRSLGGGVTQLHFKLVSAATRGSEMA
jgi:dihydrofolate reductase